MSEQLTTPCPVCSKEGYTSTSQLDPTYTFAHCPGCGLMMRCDSWNRLARAAALLRAVEGFGIDTYLSTPKDADTYYEIDKLWDGTEWALSVGTREESEEIARFPSFEAALVALAGEVAK